MRGRRLIREKMTDFEDFAYFTAGKSGGFAVKCIIILINYLKCLYKITPKIELSY